MPILDLQRKGRQIGRIRIGEKGPGGRPTRLTTFKLTTPSRGAADAVAAFLGGEVREWERGEWQVTTERDELMVTLPPRDAAISQYYEMWNRGGCLRRCDSVTNQITNSPCACPSDTLRRAEMAKMNPPQACKAITRINVMIPDLPGLGVWRLDTSSFYAAVEIMDEADLLEGARDAGVFLPAKLRIEQRQRVAGGKTTKFPVPVLEVLVTFRELASGALASAGLAAQLPPAPGEQHRAIEAAPASIPAPAPAPAAAVVPAGAGDAAQILARALIAETRDQIKILADEADASELSDDMVTRDGHVWEELKSALRTRWSELPPPTPPAEAGPDLATKKQLDRLHILFADADITDRDAKLAYATEAIGRAIESSKLLTKPEVSLVMAKLESFIKQSEPEES